MSPVQIFGHLWSKAMKTAVLAIMPAYLVHTRPLRALVFTAIGLGPALSLGFAQAAVAQQNPVTAIDIALEPDATMLQHAKDANARLLKSFPKGFPLDETHHPHVTMLQQFVRTDDLDKVFASANAVLAKEKPKAWTLKAFKYYYIPSPPVGLAGIVVEPTEDLHRLQDELIKAVEPYTVKTGTPAAFFSDEGGRDIQKDLIEYVANFTTIAAGKHFNPHVTIGVGTETYLNEMLAEPFASFTFSPAGASVYQLGTFGTARKELKALTLTP
jgi:2'-5' RNA ligase